MNDDIILQKRYWGEIHAENKENCRFTLAAVLMMSLSPMTALAVPTTGNEYLVGDETEFINAVYNPNLANGDIIKLTNNIDFNGGISFYGISVTIDLNEQVLNIRNDSGWALIVGNNGPDHGAVMLAGQGKFNVTSEFPDAVGVYIDDGCSATVTNATAIGDRASGVFANGNGSIPLQNLREIQLKNGTVPSNSPVFIIH